MVMLRIERPQGVCGERPDGLASVGLQVHAVAGSSRARILKMTFLVASMARQLAVSNGACLPSGSMSPQ